jgi:dTDP-4-amino-4,6-dideoxygalactose transaminase
MNGNYTVEFESWLAKKNNTKYAITCHSGTQALEIIAEYCIKNYLSSNNSATVLLPTLTYQATANAFLRAGWNIEFSDVDRNRLANYSNISKNKVYDATVLVGLYGAIPHYTLTNKVSTGLLLEDGAQHWLSTRKMSIANAMAISFDPMKNLSNYGNGGAVLTPDLKLAEFARAWRDNGKPGNVETGTNSRMSEIDCATMLVKTKYIDQWQHQREKIVDHWCDRLKDHNHIRCLVNDQTRSGHCFHKFVIEVDNADIVQRKIALKNIETKIHYRNPLHELPAYQQFVGPDMTSVATMLSRRVLSLPLYPELTDLEIEYIIDQLLDSV